MLSISFYDKEYQLVESVQVNDQFYQWLIDKTDFFNIGKSQSVEIQIEGEKVPLDLVELNASLRDALLAYLVNRCLDESHKALDQLQKSPSKKNIEALIALPLTLHELRLHMKNENCRYFKRTN